MVFSVAWLLMSDGVDTSDTAVKTKIEIVERAERSSDPIVKQQAVLAKEELREIQLKKERLGEKKKEREQREAQTDSSKSTVIDVLFVIFMVIILTAFAILITSVSRMRRT